MSLKVFTEAQKQHGTRAKETQSDGGGFWNGKSDHKTSPASLKVCVSKNAEDGISGSVGGVDTEYQ